MTTAAEYMAEARRLMPYKHQAFDRICFVDAALKRDDAQLCYPYPPKKDDRNETRHKNQVGQLSDLQ